MRPLGFLAAYRRWGQLKAKLFTLLARGDFAQLGPRALLQPPLRVTGPAHIAIGAQVFLGANSWLEVLPRPRARDEVAIRIGAGTSISGYCTISAAESVVLERNVLIARYAYIADHGHAFGDPDRPVKAQGITTPAPVLIREGAWLGQGVVVCPGVTIGRNAVIGANSVVRHDVPDYSVAVGAPARVVRRTLPLPVA